MIQSPPCDASSVNVPEHSACSANSTSGSCESIVCAASLEGATELPFATFATSTSCAAFVPPNVLRDTSGVTLGDTSAGTFDETPAMASFETSASVSAVAVLTRRVLGVKFSPHGQVCFVTCTDPFVRVGDRVLADTGQGLGLAFVVTVMARVPEGVAAEDVHTVLRKTTSEDLVIAEENDTTLVAAHRFCGGCIRERALDMKLVDVEMLFDRSKMMFYFTAPTRIDFRELVKDLVREYHTRIELRQIGVRHETQMLGAIGSCGMVCCCRRFLRKFVPVTIKMAKEQNLFLNPSKISGICGRLLCCLSYEQDNYDLFHRSCPRIGKRYQTTNGPVKILRGNMFRNTVVFLTETNEELEMSLDEWQILKPQRAELPPPSVSAKSGANLSEAKVHGHGGRPGQPQSSGQQGQFENLPNGQAAAQSGARSALKPPAQNGFMVVVAEPEDADSSASIDAQFDEALATNDATKGKPSA